MKPATAIKALLMSVVLAATVAAPAVASSKSFPDPEGDAPPRWDMTHVKTTNGDELIGGRAVVVNLRPGKGYFAVRFGQPSNPDNLFTASSRIRADGTLHNKLHIFGELVDHDIACPVRASWRFAADTVRVWFPRSCLEGLNGPLIMSTALGPLPRFHSQDHSRRVRVTQH
jgi:hypothetical protein